MRVSTERAQFWLTMSFENGKYTEPKSFMPAGEDFQANYADLQKLYPHVEYFLRVFGFQNLYKRQELIDQRPDSVYKKRDGESNEFVKARVEKYKQMDILMYGRLMKTVPNSMLLDFQRTDKNPKKWTGMIFWAFIQVRILENSVAFINNTQTRIRSRRLTNAKYSGNMRLMLQDFDDDFALLENTETYSTVSKVYYIRKAQCIEEGKDWSKDDPYNAIFVMLHSRLAGDPELEWSEVIKELITHYDASFKSDVESSVFGEDVSDKSVKEEANVGKLKHSEVKFGVKQMLSEFKAKASGKVKGQITKAEALFSNGNGNENGNGGGKGNFHKFKRFPKRAQANGKGGGKGDKSGGKWKGQGRKGDGWFTCNNCEKPGHYYRECTLPGGGAYKQNDRKKRKRDDDNDDDEAHVIETVLVGDLKFGGGISDFGLVSDVTNEPEKFVYIDSCATGHMTGSEHGVTAKVEAEGRVGFGDPNQGLDVTHKCKKRMVFDTKPDKHAITFAKFSLIPGLTKTLLSWYELVKVGVIMDTRDHVMLMKIPQGDGKPAAKVPVKWEGRMLAAKLHF